MNSFAMIKHFLRVLMYYKINFIFTLGVPVGSIIYTMRGYIFHMSNQQIVQTHIGYWISYMVVLYAIMNSGPSLVILREEQFLKMFLFISGSVRSILCAKFISQFLLLSISVLILDILSCLLFGLPIIRLFIQSILLIILCSPPIFSLFLFFAALPLRQETITPLINVLIFCFIFLSVSQINHLLIFVNPIDYTFQIARFLFGVTVFHAVRLWLPITVTLFYLLIGAFAVKKMRFLPIFRN
ncbi:hypothetical protein NIE88_10645 [Sporolactobacillus shoreicorticis]|uniref:ABC transporter permease n=1 Tax=Sporolactobacillus shoreicorticis TaxID=1923877 RepID=A0ABW5S8D7_9BACL|nr:hypothetical protein [Sporolactobacillus shoreicorticis]MCO7126232.1 hypothetical protein [Sporolactobacillus shoreicorticis]